MIDELINGPMIKVPRIPIMKNMNEEIMKVILSVSSSCFVD